MATIVTKKTVKLSEDGFQRALEINKYLEQGYSVKAVDGDITVVEVEKVGEPTEFYKSNKNTQILLG